MTTPNLVQTEVADLIKRTFELQIPLLWKQCFIAPMAFHGDYTNIKLPSRSMPGLELHMWKNRLECHYLGQIYSVDWSVGRPWHVKGDFVLSPNWRSAKGIFVHTLSTLTHHALKMAEHIIL
jgi:hypothetical protein